MRTRAQRGGSGGERVGLRSAGLERAQGRAQRLVERHRFEAARCIQVAVAARHRETVGLTHRRHDFDVQWKIEIGDHLAQQDRLLRILLPEKQHVGTHDVEQLGDDRRYAAKVPRPLRAFEECV